MKRHYPWLWFDADGTLFDYNLAEALALKNTFQSLSLPYEDGYLNIYQRINQSLWQALEKQEITQSVLRYRRFELLLDDLQLSGSSHAMSSIYVEQLGNCTDLIDGAYEVLDTLKEKSRIAIITNGLQAVQRSRLAQSTIKDFITTIIISEEVGVAKPYAAFFDIACAQTGQPAKSDVLVIGDSLTSDMQGGVDYGLATCWYNPDGAPSPVHLQITYEIKQLRDLLEILA